MTDIDQGTRVNQTNPTYSTFQGRRPATAVDGQSRSDSTSDYLFDEGAAAPAEPPPSPPLRRILMAIDLMMVAAGWALTNLVAFSIGDVSFGPVTAISQALMVLAAGGILLSANGLYRRHVSAIRTVEVARIGRVSVALAVVSVVVLASVGREAALTSGLVGGVSWFLLLAIERGVFREWISGRRAAGDFSAPVLVVGKASRSVGNTARFLAENPVLGFRVRGVCYLNFGNESMNGSRRFVSTEEVVDHARQCAVSGVILDSSSLTGEELNDFVQQLKTTGLHVHISSGLSGVDVRRITVSPIADETFMHIAPLGLSRQQERVKRALDIVGAVVALVLLSPVLLLASALIWIQDRGPVLFRQERVGKNGEAFQLFKLRTMVRDAEKLRAELETDNERAGPLFKLSHDPRVTRIGRFLRASSIDEIPQLFNVLGSTMSLVGPRPALPAEVAQFDEQLNTRLQVKPGVTGLWQVEARDLPSFDLYRRYDLLYVQNWSVGVDLTIIARSVVVVALRAIRAVLPASIRTQTAIE